VGHSSSLLGHVIFMLVCYRVVLHLELNFTPNKNQAWHRSRHKIFPNYTNFPSPRSMTAAFTTYRLIQSNDVSHTHFLPYNSISLGSLSVTHLLYRATLVLFLPPLPSYLFRLSTSHVFHPNSCLVLPASRHLPSPRLALPGPIDVPGLFPQEISANILAEQQIRLSLYLPLPSCSL